MGAFFGNLAVKTDNKESVISEIKKSGQSAWVAGPVNSWVFVFPADDFALSQIATNLSSSLNTTVFAGQVFDSDDLVFQVFENGETLFDFIEDKTGGEGISFITGTANDLKAIACSEFEPEKAEDIFNKTYVFAEEKYGDVLKALCLPDQLSNSWGYQYMDEDGREEEKEKDLPDLELVN